MPSEPSILRLNIMRLLYLLNFALLGLDVWPAILNHTGAWDPVKGVAFSFWGALSALSVLGLRYPVKMLPLFLLQFVYKFIWIVIVALPQWSAVRSTDLAFAMTAGIIIDLIVIPWRYVWANYVVVRGERWKMY